MNLACCFSRDFIHWINHKQTYQYSPTLEMTLTCCYFPHFWCACKHSQCMYYSKDGEQLNIKDELVVIMTLMWRSCSRVFCFWMVLFIFIIFVSVFVSVLNCTCAHMPVHALFRLVSCTFFSVRLCMCVSLQETNPYSTVTSDQTELDRRYCVLKLHVPYSDLIYSPDTNTGWDNNTVTFRQPITT